MWPPRLVCYAFQLDMLITHFT